MRGEVAAGPRDRPSPSGKLTAAWLERVRIEGGVVHEGRRQVAEGVLRVTVKDTDVPWPRASPTGTGARSWAVSKRLNGIQRRFTVPHGSRLTLADARRAAIRLLDELSDGRDPTKERRNAREPGSRGAARIGRAWTRRARRGVRVQVACRPGNAHGRSARPTSCGVPRSAPLPSTSSRSASLASAGRPRREAGAMTGWHALRYLRTVLAGRSAES